MPAKRHSPSSETGDAGELPMKRTHRTHEENQERAYIAASRRADRDIEHRYASALKASECRRKRTGRGLKITREAVMGDEQYESEEDDHPVRRFSMPASTTITTAGCILPNPNNNPNKPNNDNDSNNACDILTSSADRYAEVDALFAKHFPYFAQMCPGTRPQPQPQPQPQVHRHSYPQLMLSPQRAFPPEPLHPSYPRCVQKRQQPHQQQPPQGVSSMLGPVGHGSPLLTPPTSSNLPPAREENSVSPLTLGGARSRPGSAASATAATSATATTSATAAAAAAAQQAAGGFGVALPDAGVGGGGGYLIDDGVDPHGGYLAGSGASAQMMSAFEFSAAAAAAAAAAAGTSDLSWYAGGDGLSGVGGGWHNRSYSLPSALEQFQFDVEPAPGPTTAGVVPGVPATAALIDPAILPPAVAPATAVSSVGGTRTVTPATPSEPWSDWVNLDGDGPQPLGVKV